MASSINLLPLQTPLLRSTFLGKTPHNFSISKTKHHHFPTTKAKFNLSEILGGRGLCNGEIGIQQELNKNIESSSSSSEQSDSEKEGSDSDSDSSIPVPENGFDKELMGLTGGFPGGEKGLEKFITENPPPPKKEEKKKVVGGEENSVIVSKKPPKAPQLPLLMPGMIALVKNPNSPYHMYCGVVQRITDGKAGVLFEGGIWDRMITFRLEELERREKGPPAKNPKSVILESMLEKGSE